jgi:hypothetical protein
MFEFLGIFSLMFSGGLVTGLPMGMPPAEEDPVMARVAPDECLVYVSWSASATPDPTSKNRTEQLLADPEIRRFVTELQSRLHAAVQQGAGDGKRAKAVADELPKLMHTLATSHTAFFVGGVKLGPSGIDVPTGLIVNVGDKAAEIERSLTAIEEIVSNGQVKIVKNGGYRWHEMPTPRGVPKIRWGIAGKYLVAGVGEGTIETMLERGRSGKVPEWLAAARKRLPVGRRASTVYLNVSGGLAAAAPFMGIESNETTRIISLLGLSNVKSICSITGLDDTGCVSHTWLELDGKPTGLLAPLGGKPLTPADLAPIPADANLALAVRLDAGAIFDQFVGLVSLIDRRAGAEIAREMAPAEEALGFKFREDLFASLGDSLCVYQSPSEGGALYTGWTAVAPARNPEKLREISKLIAAAVDKEFERQRDQVGFRRRFAEIKDYQYKGQTVYFMNSVGEEIPFAPAWCVTDKQVIFSLFPQGVHAVLNRKSDAPTLASVPEVAERFKQPNAPIALTYYNSPKVFNALYPLAQMFGNILCAELQREGVGIDISILPSAPAIAKYLRPGSMAVVPSDDGIEITNRRTLPIGAEIVNLGFPVLLFGTMRMRNFDVEAQISEESFSVEPVDVEDAAPPEPNPPIQEKTDKSSSEAIKDLVPPPVPSPVP